MSDLWASVVSAGCLLRGLPLFFRAAPRTPLRVLGIIALDTLHVIRHARPLPRRRIHELALFLDFEGCVNAAWDHKDRCEAECGTVRQRLEQAGFGACIKDYLDRLRALERARPRIGGGPGWFDDVRSYREAVARLALATAAAIALTPECRDEDIHAAHDDSDVETLFRILMQCQIIDDVLDYTEDASAGLPSFLTASASLPQALELTAGASRSYAAGPGPAPGHGVFPFRLALAIFATMAQLVVRVAGRRYRHVRRWAS